MVPAGPRIYDYYDRFLRHERRYGRRELPERAQRAGFHVISETFLGTFLFPPFWLLKKYHRLRYSGLTGPALTEKVTRDIATTKNSPLGKFACTQEQRLHHRGVDLPFGIRILVVVSRPVVHPT